jgi:hypothetical protein
MLFRDIPCDAAIARPDRPSARNCNTSFALIFRTIDDYSFRRAPYTHDGRSLSRGGPQERHYRRPSPLRRALPTGPQTHDGWTPIARIFTCVLKPDLATAVVGITIRPENPDRQRSIIRTVTEDALLENSSHCAFARFPTSGAGAEKPITRLARQSIERAAPSDRTGIMTPRWRLAGMDCPRMWNG